MSETTLRLKSIADVSALNEWTRGIDKAKGALQSFSDVQRTAALKGEHEAQWGGSAGMTSGQAGGGNAPAAVNAPAPSAPPPPPVYQPPVPLLAPPGAMPRIEMPHPYMAMTRAPMDSGSGGSAGGSGMGDGMNRAAGSYIGGMGQTAMALGLGASAVGFLLTAGQTFLQLSKTVGTLDARFRELGHSAAGWGGRLGYTIAQTAGMLETYGAQTNSLDRGSFQRGAGFARTYGLDPSATLGIVGGFERLANGGAGNGFGQRDLANIAGHAASMGMGQGRMSEYLQQLQGNVNAGFEGSGTYSTNRSLAVQDFPGMVFGAGDVRGQGQSGQALLQGLGQGMNGSAGKLLMMRAMGYGAKGSTMSYEQMRIRQDMGVNDPNNVRDLFKFFGQHGLDRNHQIRALEEMGTGLPMWRISALVDSMGGKGAKGSDKNVGSELAQSGEGYTEDQYVKRAGISDYVASGRKHVTSGDSLDVKIEGEKMAAGKYVAQGMVDMNDSIVNIAKSLQNFIGLDIGKMFTDLTGGIKKLTEVVEKASHPGSVFRQSTDITPNSESFDKAVYSYNKTADDMYANMPGGSKLKYLNGYQDARMLLDDYGTDAGQK